MIKHESKQLHTSLAVAKFLEKIVIDAGVGRLSSQPSFSAEGHSTLRVSDSMSGSASGGEGKGILAQVIRDLSVITGQKPQIRRAKRSIAGFKTREGQIVGLKITLRKRKMVDFFERLIKMVLPRVRDFRGLDTKIIDKGGVLNIGLKDHVVFPEINPEQSPVSFSLGMSIVPKIKNRDKAVEQFRALGVPLKK